MTEQGWTFITTLMLIPGHIIDDALPLRTFYEVLISNFSSTTRYQGHILSQTFESEFGRQSETTFSYFCVRKLAPMQNFVAWDSQKIEIKHRGMFVLEIRIIRPIKQNIALFNLAKNFGYIVCISFSAKSCSGTLFNETIYYIAEKGRKAAVVNNLVWKGPSTLLQTLAKLFGRSIE